MPDESLTRERLSALQSRLDQVNRTWSKDYHERLLMFFVRIMPAILDAERCTIFMLDPGTQQAWSKYGTGLAEHQIKAPLSDTVVGRAISAGQAVIDNGFEPRSHFAREMREKTGFVTRNLVCVPIRSYIGRGISGAIEVLNKQGDADFTERDARQLEEVAGFLSMAVDNILLNEDILAISNRLNAQVEAFRQALDPTTGLVAESQAMRAAVEMARTLADTPVGVLIQGENGTGKEVIARYLHRQGRWAERPFVAVNCAAIPESLMESEFFGFDKGAFTGAMHAKPGRFEDADGGTLFLDEVADLTPAMQAKFLRVLQDGEGMRLGSNKVRHYDFRLITATNRDLRKEVEAGRFREDLFYRLFAVEILIPPLRERRDDIAPMALRFLAETSDRFGKRIVGFSQGVIQALEGHAWPGNVRQLRREVERMVALTPEGQLIPLSACSADLQRLPAESMAQPADGHLPDQVRALEIRLIQRALAETHGNKVRASAILGITRQGLDKKLKRYGLI